MVACSAAVAAAAASADEYVELVIDSELYADDTELCADEMDEEPTEPFSIGWLLVGGWKSV